MNAELSFETAVQVAKLALKLKRAEIGESFTSERIQQITAEVVGMPSFASVDKAALFDRLVATCLTNRTVTVIYDVAITLTTSRDTGWVEEFLKGRVTENLAPLRRDFQSISAVSVNLISQ